MFTKDQILGFIRHALTLAGGSIVTNGLFTESEMLEAVGAAITLIGFIWSWYSKKNQPVVIEGETDR
jgi:hypothetical protein